MSLKKYNQKRDFLQTNEPKGKQTKSNLNYLRFVIQYHQARAKHYDLRLEHNGVLLSWAVPKGLSLNPKDKRLAVMVEDHPIDYINFEGVIPKGNYGAGIVEIFDQGCYIPLENFTSGIKKGILKFALLGEKLKGAWSLIKTNENNWLVIKEKDEFASESLPKQKQIKNPFSVAKPELALLSTKIPVGKNWLFEIKYDGYRILAYKNSKTTKLVSRGSNDYSAKFREIANSVASISKDIPFVLDGEIVCFDNSGRSDFGLLQHNIKSKTGGFVYVVFDLLSLNGTDLRQTPLSKRKELLENLLKNCPKNIMYCSHIIGKGKDCFNVAKMLGLEGIIAKKSDSLYTGTRSGNWLKIKCYKRQEFVIGGYATTSKNKELSSILVGYYKNNQLIYCGKVGTGFSDETRSNLVKMFKPKVQSTSPFKDLPKINAIWLKPTLVTEIKFAELTKEGLLRQPSFVEIRSDKPAKSVKLEVADENL